MVGRSTPTFASVTFQATGYTWNPARELEVVSADCEEQAIARDATAAKSKRLMT